MTFLPGVGNPDYECIAARGIEITSQYCPNKSVWRQHVYVYMGGLEQKYQVFVCFTSVVANDANTSQLQ